MPTIAFDESWETSKPCSLPCAEPKITAEEILAKSGKRLSEFMNDLDKTAKFKEVLWTSKKY